MKKVVILFTFIAFLLAGCNRDPKDDPESDRQVVVFFSAQSSSSSLLKSSATEPEKTIQKILLFGVDENSNVVEKFPIINNPPSSGTALTISRKIKSLYAIANSSSTLEAANPANVTALNNLTADFSNIPQSPFIMSGKAGISGIDVDIKLVRAVAKIKIIGKNGFTISSVTVQNTPTTGYVFERTPLVVPSGKKDYSPITGANPTFYVAENTTSSPTKFVVIGQFLGKQATYTITQLPSNGTNVDIQRNAYYEINISPITENDCSITIGIPEWTDVDIDEYTPNFE